ncbi:MAG TPA: hypothetical protein VF741_07245 [Candidatus Aquilonibacter sp.]
MNAAAMVAALLLGVTTLTQPVTLRSGTRIACVMQTAVDSRTAQAGETFDLHVNDPSQPELAGARIRGHITNVYPPRGLRRAEIAFLFDSIRFASGARVPIRAYVVSGNVVQRNDTGPGAPLPPPGPIRVPNTVGPPNQSTMAWSTTLGPKPQGGSQTGGFAYAEARDKPLVVQAGTPVTIQLASDLQVP